MLRNKNSRLLFLLLIILYFISLLDLSVFGDVFSLEGEKELTEQFSLLVLLIIYIVSYISFYTYIGQSKLVVYLGYTFTALSMYISEIGIVKGVARTIFGVITIGLTLAGMRSEKNKKFILFFLSGISVIVISVSIDIVLDGVLGYLGEGSYLRNIYLKHSTLDMEEILEPIGYLTIAYSLLFYAERKKVKNLKLKAKKIFGLVIGSSMLAAGHSFFIGSYTGLYIRYKTILCILSAFLGIIIAGSAMIVPLKKADSEEKKALLSIMINTSLAFLFLMPFLGNNSDIVTIFVIFPFLIYCIYWSFRAHPNIKISRFVLGKV